MHIPADGATVVEIPTGLVVCPGLIDMHASARARPGAQGDGCHRDGVRRRRRFTAVACMPNTVPVNDNANVTTLICRRLPRRVSRVSTRSARFPGSKGELLADIAELRQAGCVAISDDGHPVATALLMRRALEYAGMFDLPLIEHCEDPTLKGDGVAHEGFHASVLGLRGIPGAAEALGVERGVLLAELTGSKLHIAHMSARASIRAVRKGKEAGVRDLWLRAAPFHADR